MLDDKIAAANARRKFAERFADSSPAGLGEKGEARPLAEWRAAFAAIAEEVAAADAAIREAKLRQREIDRELARLEAERNANPPRKMEVRIDLAADAATRATLRVTYTVRGARWVPLYDARLDTGARERKPSLELVRRAEIVQQTGEDWSDVALTVSTVRTAKGGNAPDLRPLIVRYPRAAAAARAPQRRPSPGTQLDARDVAERGRSSGQAAKASRAPMAAPNAKRCSTPAASRPSFRFPAASPSRPTRAPRASASRTATIAPELVVRAAPALDETGLSRSELQADRGGAAAAGPRRALSRRHLRRPQPDCTDAEGRDRAARLRRGREGQDRAHARAQDRRLDRHHLDRPRPTSASSRSRCATATTRRSRSRSRIRFRSARSTTSRSKCCPATTPPSERDVARSPRRAGLEFRRRRPARRARSSSAGGCAGRPTR